MKAPSEDAAELIGNSPAMVRLRELVRRAAAGRHPVLILGESGTGKELVARAVHRMGGDRRAFVAVNCAAFPAALVESELFGHVRGAFTGAEGAKEGLLKAAQGGTLFLDEVAELALEMQAKLLRVLQDGE